MSEKKSKFAEVTSKSQEKRAQANTKTAARKDAELKAIAKQVEARAVKAPKTST